MSTDVVTVLTQYVALVGRLEALAKEADAGGDHSTAARIRAALYDDDTDEDGEGEG